MIAGDERDAVLEARPFRREYLVKARGRCRQACIDDGGRRRGIVEQQEQMRQQSVSGAQIDDTAATEEPPGPPGDFPRFVQFFAGQAAGGADGAADAIEKRAAGEAPEIVWRQSGTRGWIELQLRSTQIVLTCV